MCRALIFMVLVCGFAFGQDICDEQYMKEWIDRLDSINLSNNSKAKQQGFYFGKSKCKNNTMIVNMHILRGDKIRQSDKQKFDVMVNQGICADDRNEIYADLGLLIEYDIRSDKGDLIYATKMDPKKCPNFTKSSNSCDKTYALEEINSLNAQIPLDFGDGRRLVNASCVNDTYIYRIIVDIEDNDINSNIINELKNEMQAELTNVYCADLNMKIFLKLGMSAKYDYYLQNGTFLFSTHASPSNCLNF